MKTGRLLAAGCVAAVTIGVAGASGAVARSEISPPAGIPDLSQMALRLTDLPSGAKVAKQGYVKTSDAVAEYDRVFKDGSARIGSTRLATLENDVELAADADEASFTYQQFRSIVSSKKGRQAFAKEFAKEVGVFAQKVVVGTPVPLHVGDESLALPVRVVTLFGDLRIVFALHRTDRVLSSFYFAGGFNVTITASRAATLARPIAQHIHDGLLPASMLAPTISGTAQAGQTLTTVQGTWTNNPTVYSYHWQRCDAAGATCVAIDGAADQAYVLGPTDIGSTIRVAVTAANGVGSATATTVQTAVVVAAA